MGHVKTVNNNASLRAWIANQFEPALDWEKVKRIRSQWDGKFVLKGIMSPEDAIEAHRIGADAIIVSNHGGRQLDGSLSSIRALPAILDAVGDRMEVHIDSGIRSGQDILKALAMGAHGTYIGRAYIYGLGAMGEAGVTRSLEILHKQLDLSMALCGVNTVQEIGRNTILLPRHFIDNWQ